MRDVVLYGLAGASDKYRIVRYECIPSEIATSDCIKLKAYIMQEDYPSVKEVYWITNRGGLAGYCSRTMKRNRIEDNVIFRDYLDRSGFLIQTKQD